MAVNRYAALDLEREYDRAIVRTVNGYMEQGVYTMMNTVLKRIGNSYANNLLRSVAEGQRFRASFETSLSMGQFAGLMTRDSELAIPPATVALMEQFSIGLNSRVNRKVGLLAIHQKVAAAAQLATLRAFQTRVEGNKKIPSYREGQGRLPHKLAEALARPDFMQVTPDGILFANTGMLDTVAAHWYRLNFGAGGRAEAIGSSTSFAVTFFGSPIGTLSAGGRPSPSFIVPRGVFLSGRDTVPWSADRRGSDAFYPVSMIQNVGFKIRSSDPEGAVRGPVRSKGIAGRHFLDAGIGVLASRLPTEYERLTRQWLDEASREAGRRGPLKGLEVVEAQQLRDSIQVGANLRQRYRI